MMFAETLDWNNDMLLITPNEFNNSCKKKCYMNHKLGVNSIIYDYLEYYIQIGFDNKTFF